MERDYNEDILYLGDQIRQFREHSKMSQEELADRLEVSPITIHRIENGVRAASLESLFKFSDTMNVPLALLLPPRMQNGINDEFTSVFRKLNPSNQKIVCKTIDTLMKSLLASQN